jgi:hypothetical protein
VYYVQFRSNASELGYPIGPFVSRVEHEIVAARSRSMVLDLRLDQGCNFVTTAAPDEAHPNTDGFDRTGLRADQCMDVPRR